MRERCHEASMGIQQTAPGHFTVVLPTVVLPTVVLSTVALPTVVSFYRRLTYRRFILPSPYLPSEFRGHIGTRRGNLKLGVRTLRAEMLEQLDLPLLNVPQLVPLFESQRIQLVV